MKAMNTFLVDMEKNLATMKTQKRLLAKFNAELLSSSTRKRAKSSCTGKSFWETITPTNLRCALRVEKAVVPYCCREVSECLPFNPKLQSCWWRRGENVLDSEVPREDQTSFAPGSPFHSCFLHTSYTLSISSPEQGLQRLWKLVLIKNNRPDCFRCKNWWSVLCEFCIQTKI